MPREREHSSLSVRQDKNTIVIVSY